MRKENKISNRAVLWALIISLLVLGIFVTLIIYSSTAERKSEELETTKKYVSLQNRFESFIDSETNLLKGFKAYIQTHDSYTDNDIYEYLEFLLKEDLDIIRNVGVIKDNIITWNYPYEENIGSIGVDLSKIEEQAGQLEYLERNLVDTVQGPIDLVQGGTGFIIRTPMFKNEEFWGISSIVIKGEAVTEIFEQFSYDNQLDIFIREQNDPDNVIFGDKKVFESNPIYFSFENSLLLWDIYITPSEGWNTKPWHQKYLFLFLSVLASCIICYLSFKRINRYYAIARQNTHLKVTSSTDNLTGISNRAEFNKRAYSQIEYANRYDEALSLLFIDLDLFKNINDSFGHSAGDQVLISTVNIIKSILRNSDVFARWGGEEFIIMVPATDLRGTIFVADKIRRAVEASIIPKAGNITVSIGVASHNKKESFDSWFKRADYALNQAKSRGRNTVVFSCPNKYDDYVQYQIRWQEDWVSGNNLVDLQHKSLIEQANRLIDYILEDNENKAQFLQEFVSRIKEHFNDEERILKNINSSFANEYSAERTQYISGLKDIMDALGHNAASYIDVFQYVVKRVLISHIVLGNNKYYRN